MCNLLFGMWNWESLSHRSVSRGQVERKYTEVPARETIIPTENQRQIKKQYFVKFLWYFLYCNCSISLMLNLDLIVYDIPVVTVLIHFFICWPVCCYIFCCLSFLIWVFVFFCFGRCCLICWKHFSSMQRIIAMVSYANYNK